mmetsp:Transcript_7992/g.15711  ORF Transcript_7992/g.15711 Transcript_7992/m.15711 type:complete len:1031 (-) Transcript_7992:2738-5830(-)
MNDKQHQLIDDLRQYRSMYEELRSRDNRSPLAQIYKNTDSFDRQLPKKWENSDDEKDLTRHEISILKETKKLLEVTNSDLIRRLELSEGANEQLKQMLAESEEEAQQRQDVIKQAQGIIKRLNSELEAMVYDLDSAEKTVEQFKRKNRQLEQALSEMQIQVKDFEDLKKTEERLRKEAVGLKAEMQELLLKKDEKVKDISEIAEQATEEKRMLEEGIGMLEAKLEEIEKHNQFREELLKLQKVEMEELRLQLAQKTEEVSRVQEEYEVLDSKRNEEFATLKRHAENVMRQLYPVEEVQFTAKPIKETASRSFSNLRKCTAVKKSVIVSKEATLHEEPEVIDVSLEPQILTEDLKLQLHETQEREFALQQALRHIIETEGQFIGGKLETLKSLELTARPEVERWIMRNEELEQKLESLAGDSDKLAKLVVDLQKALTIKHKQMQDQKLLSEALRKELTVALDFVRAEALESHETLLKDLLPLSNQMLQDLNSDITKAKKRSCRDSAKLRKRLEGTEKSLAEIVERNQELHGELMAAREAVSRSEVDFKQIRSALDIGDVSSSSERTPSFHGDELDYAVQISQPAGEVLNAIKGLKLTLNSLRTECYEKLAEIERERPFVSDYRAKRLVSSKDAEDLRASLSAKEFEWGRERQRLLDQLRQAKESAFVENEARFAVQRTLEEENSILRNSLAETQKKLAQTLSSHPGKILDFSILDDSVEIANRSTQSIGMKGRPRLDESSFLSDSRDASPSVRASQDSLLNENNELRKEIEALKLQLNRKENASGSTSPIQSFLHKRCSSDSGKVFSFPKRSVDINTGEQITQYYEKMLEAKNTHIAKLEDQVDHLQKSQDTSLKSSVFNSLRSSMASDAHQSRDQEALHIRYDKLKWKIDHQMKRHERRVKEFELILRFVEDKIGAVTTGKPISSKLMMSIEGLAKKNSSFKRWLDDITNKLELIGPRQLAREKRTLSEIVSLLMDSCETYANLEPLSALYKELSIDSVDMTVVSNKVIDWLYKSLKGKIKQRDLSLPLH